MCKYTITKNIRLIELFAGIGSQAMALRDCLSSKNITFEHYKVIEVDKYAIKSYNAIHNTNFEPTDIKTIKGKDLDIVDTDKYEYILTYSFPCVDISVAGRQQGMEESSGTRSSLLWEVKRLLLETKNKPQILLMENVIQVHNKNNIEHFNKWLDFLSTLGYKTVWQDLNAKDYSGIPQSRKRCFAISILGDYDYTFPKPIPLRKLFYELLDKEVDDLYVVTKPYIYNLINDCFVNATHITDLSNIEEDSNVCPLVFNEKAFKLYNKNAKHQQDLIQLDTDICRCIPAGTHGSTPHLTKTLIINQITSIPKGIKKDWVWKVGNTYYNIYVRRLTPKEVWRVMGFSDQDFEKAEPCCSSTQLYKQGGNSIVKPILTRIFEQLL